MRLKQVSNNQLTLLRKLNRKKYREQEQLFLLEGARAVEQVVANGAITVEGLFFDNAQSYWQQEAWNKMAEDYPSSVVPWSDFAEISDTDNPQGVLALCGMPAEADINEMANREGLITATDSIQDPGNLGTIIRTAAWFGVKGFLSGKGTVDLFHPKVVRSTAGATGSIAHKNVSLEEALITFEQKGWHVLILDGSRKADNLRQIQPNNKTILLIGNEANGVDNKLFSDDRRRVQIPSNAGGGSVESLNAAIATGIALFALNK